MPILYQGTSFAENMKMQLHYQRSCLPPDWDSSAQNDAFLNSKDLWSELTSLDFFPPSNKVMTLELFDLSRDEQHINSVGKQFCDTNYLREYLDETSNTYVMRFM